MRGRATSIVSVTRPCRSRGRSERPLIRPFGPPSPARGEGTPSPSVTFRIAPASAGDSLPPRQVCHQPEARGTHDGDRIDHRGHDHDLARPEPARPPRARSGSGARRLSHARPEGLCPQRPGRRRAQARGAAEARGLGRGALRHGGRACRRDRAVARRRARRPAAGQCRRRRGAEQFRRLAADGAGRQRDRAARLPRTLGIARARDQRRLSRLSARGEPQ